MHYLGKAHHRTTFGIFCNITEITTPEKIAAKYSIFHHQLYFFIWEVQGPFFLDKDQISSLKGKRKG